MSLHFAIAAIPLAVYFILVGGLRLRKHPLITTGWRDTLTLGIACSGLVAIGPMQLFFPDHFAARWHTWVWLALFLLYVLGLLLVLLSCKPRLIAYGLDELQFRESLLTAAQQVDPAANWTGSVLTLPGSGIQLADEPSGTARVHQVAHVGLLHNIQDWLRLEKAFVAVGSQLACPRSWAGWPFVLGGCLLLVAAIAPLLSDPAAALAQLKEFLDR
ncbi:MAG: hypothetical protein R3C53_06495 [Pirellulaceae bacterium]